MSGEPVGVTTESGPWGMVPVWVLGLGLSGSELAVYVALRSYADRSRACFPLTASLTGPTCRLGLWNGHWPGSGTSRSS